MSRVGYGKGIFTSLFRYGNYTGCINADSLALARLVEHVAADTDRFLAHRLKALGVGNHGNVGFFRIRIKLFCTCVRNKQVFVGRIGGICTVIYANLEEILIICRLTGIAVQVDLPALRENVATVAVHKRPLKTRVTFFKGFGR